MWYLNSFLICVRDGILVNKLLKSPSLDVKFSMVFFWLTKKLAGDSLLSKELLG